MTLPKRPLVVPAAVIASRVPAEYAAEPEHRAEPERPPARPAPTRRARSPRATRGRTGRPGPIPADLWANEEIRRALASRDIGRVYRLLQEHGISQRHVGYLVGQSQSEVSEIAGGRRVVTYDTLARISDGLGVPRGWMGLASTNDVPVEPAELLLSRLEAAATLLHQAAVALLRALGDGPNAGL